MPPAQQAPFTIAGHTVAPGKRLQFDLPIANLYTHAPLNMSVEVIHGMHYEANSVFRVVSMKKGCHGLT